MFFRFHIAGMNASLHGTLAARGLHDVSITATRAVLLGTPFPLSHGFLSWLRKASEKACLSHGFLSWLRKASEKARLCSHFLTAFLAGLESTPLFYTRPTPSTRFWSAQLGHGRKQGRTKKGLRKGVRLFHARAYGNLLTELRRLLFRKSEVSRGV